ncbi:hypothetical protein DVQ15_15725 [Yersinia enterocolitica]|jgi:hypothetical protein|nr:hypothetical protein [Yersinia enterocolitica]
MYSHDLQIKYLQFRSRVEMNPDEDGMNLPDFDSHANVRSSLIADPSVYPTATWCQERTDADQWIADNKPVENGIQVTS